MIKTLKWKQIEGIIKKVNPSFHELLAKIDGIHSYNFTEYSYKYGSIIGDRECFYGPDGSIINRSIPFGIFTDKDIELFIDLNDCIIPDEVYEPGDLICTGAIVKNSNQYALDFFNICAGARSPVMLHNVANQHRHRKISKYYESDIIRPTSINKHYNTLKEIAHNANDCSWRAKFLAFPDDLVTKIKNDVQEIELYIHKYINKKSEFDLHADYYDMLMTYCKSRYNNVSTNMYINSILHHMNRYSCGSKPTFRFATTENSLPLKYFQDVYQNIYKSDEAPLFLVPSVFSKNRDKTHYFSLGMLQKIYKPNSNVKNIMVLLDEIKDSYDRYCDNFIDLGELRSSKFYKTFLDLELNIVNNKASQAHKKGNALFVSDLHKIDQSINKELEKLNLTQDSLPMRSPFFNGCLALKETTGFRTQGHR